jgi:hypothetical protein
MKGLTPHNALLQVPIPNTMTLHPNQGITLKYYICQLANQKYFLTQTSNKKRSCAYGGVV